MEEVQKKMKQKDLYDEVLVVELGLPYWEKEYGLAFTGSYVGSGLWSIGAFFIIQFYVRQRLFSWFTIALANLAMVASVTSLRTHWYYTTNPLISIVKFKRKVLISSLVCISPTILDIIVAFMILYYDQEDIWLTLIIAGPIGIVAAIITVGNLVILLKIYKNFCSIKDRKDSSRHRDEEIFEKYGEDILFEKGRDKTILQNMLIAEWQGLRWMMLRTELQTYQDFACIELVSGSNNSKDIKQTLTLSERGLTYFKIALELIQEIAVNEDTCSICGDDYSKHDYVKIFPGGKHIYHANGIRKWISQNTKSSCPVGRNGVQSQLIDYQTSTNESENSDLEDQTVEPILTSSSA